MPFESQRGGFPAAATTAESNTFGHQSDQGAIGDRALGFFALTAPPSPFLARRRLFSLPAPGIENRHVGLGDHELGGCDFIDLEIAVFHRADKLDEVFLIRKDVDAQLFGPLGGLRAQQTLEMAVLEFHGSERGVRLFLGQVAEDHEVVAVGGGDLGVELGVGQLPALAAHGLDILVALPRRERGELRLPRPVGACRMRLHRRLRIDY